MQRGRRQKAVAKWEVEAEAGKRGEAENLRKLEELLEDLEK